MSHAYACPVGDLPEGETFRLSTSSVTALFNVGDEFYAINGRCSHGNTPMSKGYLEGDATVECPLHAVSFYLKTGKVLYPPATNPLTTYMMYVSGSDMFANIPGDAR